MRQFCLHDWQAHICRLKPSAVSWFLVFDTCGLPGLTELQRYFQVSPKLLGFEEACSGLESVVLCVASRALRNLATSDLLQGYSWSRMFAPGKSMQADLHAHRIPYILIIHSLPIVFVLFLLLYFRIGSVSPDLNV